MSRKNAREIALHLIFELGFKEFEADEILLDRLDDSVRQAMSEEISLYAGDLSDEQKNYITAVVHGVASHLSMLDEKIAAHSTNWEANRLSRMTTAVLRLALYEMLFVDDVPEGAAINEAVELAKLYDSKEASAFINGVLGAVTRQDI